MGAREAEIELTEARATVASAVWFVLNIADTTWLSKELRRAGMDEHGAQGRRVRHHEIGIHLLEPDGLPA